MVNRPNVNKSVHCGEGVNHQEIRNILTRKMVSAPEVMDTVAYYPSVHSQYYHSMQSLRQRGKMRGARRVIAFCLLTAVLPTILLVIPLYLRHSVFADVTYSMAESDVLEIVDGISSVFCQEHVLRMNSSFQAFQVRGPPQLSSTRKHVRLKKNMSLVDDTLEYWGFHLLKGSIVELSLCSRYEGSRLLVVEGERNLRACGLMEHSEKPLSAHMSNGHGQVRVTFNTKPDYLDRADTTIRINRFSPTIYTQTTPPTSTVSVIDTGKIPNEEFEGEDLFNVEDDTNLKYLHNFSQMYIEKHILKNNFSRAELKTDESTTPGVDLLNTSKSRKHRHAISRQRNAKSFSKHASKMDNTEELTGTRNRRKRLAKLLNAESKDFMRQKRSNTYFKEGHVLEARVGHGLAGNVTQDGTSGESSVSSFENNLLTCYDGQILLIQRFPPSKTCTAEKVLDDNNFMKTTHEVESDGFYYYIFYSDNDLVVNDMHAIFFLDKPTYQYSNLTMHCINQTECTFPISFWSDQTVIVEVPTRNGFEGESGNVTFLVSSCYPRMSVYIIFPVSVLFIILACAFL